MTTPTPDMPHPHLYYIVLSISHKRLLRLAVCAGTICNTWETCVKQLIRNNYPYDSVFIMLFMFKNALDPTSIVQHPLLRPSRSLCDFPYRGSELAVCEQKSR